MKNQYFGDINDYLKYGLLRIIAAETKLRIAVCWMLTEDDSRPDGKKTRYLSDPSAWRQFDPPLFGILKHAVKTGCRSIEAAETEEIVPSAAYQSELLPDDAPSRKQYLERTDCYAAVCDIVFFDPDNGMEIKTRKKGNKESSKFLYWDEVRHYSAMGKPLIGFQHFARVKRDEFIRDMTQRFILESGAAWVGALVSPNVVFFVVPAAPHEESLTKACESVCRQWHPHLRMG